MIGYQVKSLSLTNFWHIVTTLKWWVQYSQMLPKRGIMVKWTVLKKMGKEWERKEQEGKIEVKKNE